MMTEQPSSPTAWPPPSGLPHYRSILDLHWHTTAVYPFPERVCARCGAFDDMHRLPTSCGEFLPPGPRPTLPPPSGQMWWLDGSVWFASKEPKGDRSPCTCSHVLGCHDVDLVCMAPGCECGDYDEAGA